MDIGKMQRLQNIRRIAILGAGPAGVAAAKYLVAEKIFTQIDIFEQKSTCAGLWNYTSENDREAHFAVPQTAPYHEPEQPIWRHGKDKNPTNDPSNKHATFISPLYERLESNLPKMIMQHSDFPFPEQDQLFPTHDNVTEYLERPLNTTGVTQERWLQYGNANDQQVRNLIHFETQILKVEAISRDGNKGWSITSKSLNSSKENIAEYDAVAVTSGHFTVPFIPDIPGITEWNSKYPNSITHSKFFRRPEDFTHKKVLTIGTGSSGTDIASQIELFCTSPLYVSSRSSSSPDNNTTTRQNLSGLSAFLPATRSIRFTEGGTISDIDAVVFCTGYLYSYPFLATSPLPETSILSTGLRTENVYQHIFYNADPSLAFIGLPKNIVPFPICEAQSAAVAGVWTGRLNLPSEEAMKEWEKTTVAEKGDGRLFHTLPTPEDGRYLNMLHDWTTTGVLPLLSDSTAPVNGETEQVGRQPPYWDAKTFWIRERIAEIKKAFSALGEQRCGVRTLEELGFDYDAWKRENGEIEGGKESEGGGGGGVGLDGEEI